MEMDPSSPPCVGNKQQKKIPHRRDKERSSLPLLTILRPSSILFHSPCKMKKARHRRWVPLASSSKMRRGNSIGLQFVTFDKGDGDMCTKLMLTTTTSYPSTKIHKLLGPVALKNNDQHQHEHQDGGADKAPAPQEDGLLHEGSKHNKEVTGHDGMREMPKNKDDDEVYLHEDVGPSRVHRGGGSGDGDKKHYKDDNCTDNPSSQSSWDSTDTNNYDNYDDNEEDMESIEYEKWYQQIMAPVFEIGGRV